jgi:spermidine synthase
MMLLHDLRPRDALRDPVKPWIRLDQAAAPDGTVLALQSCDGEFLLLADGKPLMSSRLHGSEDALAVLACRRMRAVASPRVLIGGLGMGFTLRAALDALPTAATVVVAELVPAVVRWNRGPLGPLAGHPLEDARVRIEETDVAVAVRSNPGAFDAVLLDVDNGSEALTTSTNGWLYSDRGVEAIRSALSPGGVLAMWLAVDDRKFARRLRQHGFTVDAEHVRGRLDRGGPRHTILLAYQSVGR